MSIGNNIAGAGGVVSRGAHPALSQIREEEPGPQTKACPPPAFVLPAD